MPSCFGKFVRTSFTHFPIPAFIPTTICFTAMSESLRLLKVLSEPGIHSNHIGYRSRSLWSMSTTVIAEHYQCFAVFISRFMLCTTICFLDVWYYDIVQPLLLSMCLYLKCIFVCKCAPIWLTSQPELSVGRSSHRPALRPTLGCSNLFLMLCLRASAAAAVRPALRS